MDGVLDARVGYIGGHKENPSYEQVCYQDTGHAEAVELSFDNERISFEELCEAFFNLHDPTQKNRQGPDVGDQYRSAIFTLDHDQQTIAERMIADKNKGGVYSKPIATLVTSAQDMTFWPAEAYHQRYIEKQGGTCSYLS
jgi:peptide-methionine (S)-S-oxide reductase